MKNDTNYISRYKDSYLEYSEEKIPNVYKYMIENYDKIMYWIESLSKTATSQYNYKCLKTNLHTEEDLIQETYARILKTFYDNEKRFEQCSKCQHQCNEFKYKTKKTNTEKFVEGATCRPYMFYSYTEKELHNYINKSLKQNIDLKLEKLNSPAEKTMVRLDAPISNGKDEGETETFLSFLASVDGYNPLVLESVQELLKKKIVLAQKIDSFSTLKDPLDESNYEEIIEDLPNPKYNESYEKFKAEKREVYSKCGMTIPSELQPIPETIKYNLGFPWADAIEEFNSRFDLIRSKCEQKYNSNIGVLELKSNIPSEIELDEILTDEDIIDSLLLEDTSLNEEKNSAKKENLKDKLNLKESMNKIIEAKEWAEFDMMEEFEPNYSLDGEKSTIVQKYIDHVWEETEYIRQKNMEEELKFFENEVEMVYDKDMEIRIVSSDCKIIPLPLYKYVEMSIREFMELAKESKENNITNAFHTKLFKESTYDSTLKYFWMNFEQRRYNIVEADEHTLSLETRKFMCKMALKLALAFKKEGKFEYISSIKRNKFPVFKLSLVKKARKEIEKECKKMGCAAYTDVTKRKMYVPRKIKLTESERTRRANEKIEYILDLKKKAKNSPNDTSKISREDAKLLNLNKDKLILKVWEKIPVQEIKYVVEEVDVLCTHQIRNCMSEV